MKILLVYALLPDSWIAGICAIQQVIEPVGVTVLLLILLANKYFRRPVG